jgi:hypothetical protein
MLLLVRKHPTQVFSVSKKDYSFRSNLYRFFLLIHGYRLNVLPHVYQENVYTLKLDIQFPHTATIISSGAFCRSIV